MNRIVPKKYNIKPISKNDINQEYINTLNDKSYMRWSKNKSKDHSIESQIAYIANFKTFQANRIRYLFGIFDELNLIGSMTLTVNLNRKTVEIGILIFRNYSGEGVGSFALGTLSKWAKNLYPEYKLYLGTHRQNIKMQSLALRCGYKKVDVISENIFYEYVHEQHYGNLVDHIFGINNKFVFFSGGDTGGVQHLTELYLNYSGKKLLSVYGAGKKVLQLRGIRNSNYKINAANNVGAIVVSTDSNPVKVLKTIFFSRKHSIKHFAVLDHWFNYKSRFGNDSNFYPDNILTTNQLSTKIAKNIFRNSNIIKIPDLRLEYLRTYGLVSQHFCVPHILILLEPFRDCIGEAEEISWKQYEAMFELARQFSYELNISKIILRPHPIQDIPILNYIISKYEYLEIDKWENFEDHLCCVKIVIGISSSLLYYCRKLGIPSHSVIKFGNQNWLDYVTQDY